MDLRKLTNGKLADHLEACNDAVSKAMDAVFATQVRHDIPLNTILAELGPDNRTAKAYRDALSALHDARFEAHRRVGPKVCSASTNTALRNAPRYKPKSAA